MTSRLPSLGPRGEGWVGAQVVLFVVIGLAGLFDPWNGGSASPWGPVATLCGVGAIFVGGFVAWRAARDLRAGLSPFPRPVAGAPLIESGAYRQIRHPIYSGLLLCGIGWSLIMGSIVAVAATGLLFLLFDAKSRREEAWLSAAHPEYRAYRSRTKRLIPGIY